MNPTLRVPAEAPTIILLALGLLSCGGAEPDVVPSLDEPADASAENAPLPPPVPDIAPSEPLFADVWIGGPLDSIYNAEYERLQTVCAGEPVACFGQELDTTAVRLAPVFSSPVDGEPAGWLVARLRARGAWPYAALLFSRPDRADEQLIDDVGDWGYGVTLDLTEARDGWIRPAMMAALGEYWIGPDGGRGLGLVDGPYGLEGRLWRLGPITANELDGGDALAEGVYMILEVRNGIVRLRPEVPADMDCGEPVDSEAAAQPSEVYEIPLGRLLDERGRPAISVAYPKGC